jgi:hypothetical protein
VVAVVGWHGVEPQCQFPPAGQGEGPGAVCAFCGAGGAGGAGGEVPVARWSAGARLSRELAQKGFGYGDVHACGQRVSGPAGRLRFLSSASAGARKAVAAGGAGDAVAGRVAPVVDDGDFPAGARGAGGGLGEVAGLGGVEGAEQSVLAGPPGPSLEGGQWGRELDQRRPAPVSVRLAASAVPAAAITTRTTAAITTLTTTAVPVAAITTLTATTIAVAAAAIAAIIAARVSAARPRAAVRVSAARIIVIP